MSNIPLYPLLLQPPRGTVRRWTIGAACEIQFWEPAHASRLFPWCLVELGCDVNVKPFCLGDSDACSDSSEMIRPRRRLQLQPAPTHPSPIICLSNRALDQAYGLLRFQLLLQLVRMVRWLRNILGIDRLNSTSLALHHEFICNFHSLETAHEIEGFLVQHLHSYEWETDRPSVYI